MIKSSTDTSIMSSNERLTAPNPLYSSVTISKSADVAINNPLYQSEIRTDSLINHDYEAIATNNIVVEHITT